MLHARDVAAVAALTTPADYTPHLSAVPTLVQLARSSTTVTEDTVRRLQSGGFAARTMPSADHSAHRNDAAGFLEALRG